MGLLAMADDVSADLLDKGYALIPEFVHLTGSLAGQDWDETSDMDFHLGIDLQRFSDPEMAKRYFGLYARVWNQQAYELAGHKVELYFQDAREPHVSQGVYDIAADAWLKAPDEAVPPPQEALKAARALASRVEYLVQQAARWPKAKLKSFLEKAMAQWRFIRLMRKQGLAGPRGYASFGNQAFKALRRNGAISALLELIKQVRQAIYASASVAPEAGT